MLNEARINSLTRELEVLDAQRRGLAAELRQLAGHRVNPGSVIASAIAYLRRFGGPATTTEILDFIIAERPRLNRRACAVTLYRAERRKQIVREGPGRRASTPASATTSRAADAPGPARPCGRLRRRRGRGRDVAGTIHRTRGRMARPGAGGRGRRRGPATTTPLRTPHRGRHPARSPQTRGHTRREPA